jgi:hypothetical protein
LVQLPTKFEFAIKLKTTKALGLAVYVDGLVFRRKQAQQPMCPHSAHLRR